MNNIFDSLKLTLFELVGYVLPGLFLEIIIFTLLFPLGFLSINNYIPLILIFAYPVGQLLHSISNIIDYDLRSFGWLVYHKIKEKDQDGHGVKNPVTKLGKVAKHLRTLIEDNTTKSEQYDIDQVLKSKLDLKNISNFDLFFIKESLLAESNNIATSFEHLHYQKVFNRSMAFIFACITIFLPFAHYFHILAFHISRSSSITINPNLLALVITNAIIYKVFYERSKFFKNYREKIMNSAVRIYLSKT